MIAIRPARPDDAAAIAAIYAPHVTDGIASFETIAPDAAEIARRMATGGDQYPWLVAEDNEVRAYAYASAYNSREAYRRTVETTIYVVEGAQGHGVGSQLYRTLLDTLADQGFTQAIARLALPNPASVALHEAIGFRPVGTLTSVGWKHGCWIDVALWQAALDTRPDQPAL